MFNVSVLSVEAATCHSTYIIKMGMPFQHLVPHIVGVVRSKALLQELETDRILDNGRTKSISHSDPLLLFVLTRSGLIPVPRNEVTVNGVGNVYDTNNNKCDRAFADEDSKTYWRKYAFGL